MIAKELDPFHSDEPREISGRLAEQQMAFYLQRKFGTDKDVHVINGLRFQHEGIYTQIDHLLVTKWGFFVVESKSVTTSVKVNVAGEWTRLVDGAWKGMASPLLQGEAQLVQLVKMLQSHSKELLGKFIGIQRGFGGFERVVYCAVSDNGIIEREKPDLFPAAKKADQVPGAILSDIENINKRASVLRGPIFSANVAITFLAEDLLRTVAFILGIHEPLSFVPPPSPPPRAPESLRSNVLILPGTDAPSEPVVKPSGGYFCFGCQAGISRAVAGFCWNNKKRFGGKAYCMSCQKQY